MSGVIKADLLGSFGADGVYVVDPKAIARDQAGRVRVNRGSSPEELARAIVDQAKDEAASVISAARDEADAIRAAAYEEGRDAASAELDTERRAIRETCARIEADVERRVEEFWTTIEPDLLKLAVEIARKVTRREIEGHEEFVLDTVRAGLRQLRDRRDLKVRVNPDDYEFVRSHKEDIAASCDGMRSLEIIDDRRVDQGGCIIESDNGHLDGRIETQLAEIERALLEASHDGRTEVAPDA